MRFAILFGATIALFLGFCLWVTGIGKNPYPGPVDLTQLVADDYLVTNRLDERYRAGLKVRSVERSGSPSIAAFGSHAVKYMSAESLGMDAGGGDGQFINFYVMHS